jgi:hypothetical protein
MCQKRRHSLKSKAVGIIFALTLSRFHRRTTAAARLRCQVRKSSNSC